MKYIKIITHNNYSKQNHINISIEDEQQRHSMNITLILPYPLEIINGISDELIIPVFNGIINHAYIKRLVYQESTNKEKIIKEYLECPNIFLFKGVNYIKVNNKDLKIEMEKIYE